MIFDILLKLKNSIFTFLFLLIYTICYAQEEDGAYISNYPDTIALKEQFTCQSRFVDINGSGNFINYWNWSVNILHIDTTYVLTSEDSVYGYNICNWISCIDTLFLPYDSIKNDIFYIKVDGFDSDSTYYISYEPIHFKNPNTTNIYFRKTYQLPIKFRLYQNYPNPFNPSTRITFDIPEIKEGLMTVKVVIYDILGQKVKTLLNSSVRTGRFELKWDGTNDLNQVVPSGIYIYNFKSDLFNASKKMVLMR